VRAAVADVQALEVGVLQSVALVVVAEARSDLVLASTLNHSLTSLVPANL
jgi:hypothetical protein